MTILRLYFFSAIITAALILTGCKSKKDDDELIVPARELYSKGLTLLERGKYQDAAREFQKIFFQHPGNDITPQAELMQAYSHFENSQFDDAIDVLETFIKLHPMHSDISYAYYLRALSYYMQISEVALDQSKTHLAKTSCEEVIKRFPNTKYALDARLKIDLVNEHLAGKEVEIGRYYLYKKNPMAAILRFQEAINNYQTTSHTPEALYRIVEGFIMLGLGEEAKKYAAVLGYNYPTSNWYKYAYHLINRFYPNILD